MNPFDFSHVTCILSRREVASILTPKPQPIPPSQKAHPTMSIQSMIYLISFLLFNIAYVTATDCTPFHSNFPPSSISDSNSPSHSHFIAASPPGSYKAGEKGLELYLRKPKGVIRTKDGVNDKLADGATINSTFTMR
jgi:hypothetical protein